MTKVSDVLNAVCSVANHLLATSPRDPSDPDASALATQSFLIVARQAYDDILTSLDRPPVTAGPLSLPLFKGGGLGWGFESTEASTEGLLDWMAWFAGCYERFLDHEPVIANGELKLQSRRGKRKRAGIYYTNQQLVRHVVQSALEPLDVQAVTVLDPAAGAGGFLVAAADYLARRQATDGEAYALAVRYAIENCLFGSDTDPVALELARLSLGALATWPTLPPLEHFHLECADFLASPGPFAGLAFDAVIGNPPYLSFSGRQRAAGFDHLRGPGGWRSSHGFFMLKGMERLKSGGMLAMVVPDQIGHLPGYGPTRAALLREGHLVGARYWGDDAFFGAVTPVMTFCVRRGGRACSADVVLRDGRQVALSPRGEDVWRASPDADLLRRMSEAHRAIHGFADPGVHTGNAAQRLILSAARPGAVPVLAGRQVRPYRCDPPERWLDLAHKAAPGEYFRIGPEERYAEVAIVLRQTADRPIAARHRFGCHFRNSVLALSPPPGYSVEYLLGVLNSETAKVLYQSLSPESAQRAFPQVKVGVLRRLPIPDPVADPRSAREIERLVREVEEAEAVRFAESRLHVDRTAGGTRDPGAPRIDDVRRQIDCLVARMYRADPPPGEPREKA